MPHRDFWRGKDVFVTGHTGFKGGWLVAWLLDMGARVHGLALAPETDPSFFALAGIEGRVASRIGDVRSADVVADAIGASGAVVAFHLAAQPFVRRSYQDPVGTMATNVVGTAHFLEAVRRTASVRAAVVVTSDKCYEARDAGAAYREGDPLGGHDPYSASKACAEIVTAAWRRSFFAPEGRTAIASARAGNVIGGGDWGEDRIVPDAVRALSAGRPIPIRNPGHVRPWQHVLDPLHGYLLLAETLVERPAVGSGSWNFGPAESDSVPVQELATRIVDAWGSGSWEATGTGGPHEAKTLRLDPARAREVLGWRSRLALDDAIRWTVEWYRAALAPGAADVFAYTTAQIRAYEAREALP